MVRGEWSLVAGHGSRVSGGRKRSTKHAKRAKRNHPASKYYVVD
jgi:hypothetical protein